MKDKDRQHIGDRYVEIFLHQVWRFVVQQQQRYYHEQHQRHRRHRWVTPSTAKSSRVEAGGAAEAAAQKQPTKQSGLRISLEHYFPNLVIRENTGYIRLSFVIH